MTLASGARLGPYEVAGKIGEGGMGEVWRATDTRLRRQVALKVLPEAFTADAERLARFAREAQLLAQLQHPNIAAIYGVEETDGVRALVMELVEGPTLAQRLATGPLPVDDAIALAIQLARALEEAHERGIVHRDLKPANLKITPDGRLKVLDFGLARALDPPTRSSSGAAVDSPTFLQSPTLTAPGTQLGVILGTAGYMSPEQARGKPVDRRADIWSFGVVVFEMLTGRRLFAADDTAEILAAVLRQEIDWEPLPATTPAAVRTLLARCLDRNPQTRLRDIGEARVVLERLAQGGGGDAVAPAVVGAARSWVGQALAILLAGLAIGAVAAWLLGRRAEAPPPAPAVRAVLPLPPGVTIELDGERAGMPALSHDGRHLAYGAREGAGPMRIWVHELASGQSRPLPGSEGGSRPFWSPDDRQIGFFTWNHLVTTAASGGPIRRLAAARDARGGSWSRNGTILFAPHQFGPLLAIAEQGGEARPATTIRVDGPATHRFPQFLPDGEHFLYLERVPASAGGAEPSVLVGRLGASEPVVRLFGGATNALYADGHLLYVRDGALLAQPFDAQQRRLAGEARTLLSDVLYNVRFGYGVFTASDRGVVAFLSGRQHDRAQLVWRDRTGRRLGELGLPGVLSGTGGLALSADGHLAAVSRIELGGSEADVWVYDLVRGTETRLARPGYDDSNPVFTPDGRTLYYDSRRGFSEAPTVVRRDLASGAEREWMASSAGWVFPMAVSPDGVWLAFDRSDAALLGEFDVVLRPLAGGGEELVVAGGAADEQHGQISSDGRFVAWTSDESGAYEVYVAPIGAATARIQVSRAGGVQPRWNPAGGELFFKSPDNVLTAVPIVAGGGTLSVGAPQPLFAIAEFFGWTYAVAPDGERFLVREPLAEADASPLTVLTAWRGLLAPG